MRGVRKTLKAIVPKQLHPEAVSRMIIDMYARKRVLWGPFSGMRYADQTTDGAYYQRLLGTYELELREIIETLCRRRFRRVINVGAGEGYYAVGFAIRNPLCSVIAYEKLGQTLISQMAKRNGVEDRVGAYGLCDITSLSANMDQEGSNLVMMDAEGAESVLLDPVLIPNLRQAYILVELHDFIVSGIGTLITERFKSTHRITEIWTVPRSIQDLASPILRAFPPIFTRHFVAMMNERRPCKMRWFFMEPLSILGIVQG